MPVFLYVIGSFIGIAGLLALGFSIPIRDFSLGNSLIGAGATALVGGFILFGLGAAVRELRRLGRAIERQNQSLASASADTSGKPARSSRVTGPIPVAVPMPARAAQHDEADDELANERRPSIFGVVRGGSATERFEIEETDDVAHSPPVAPRAPERAPEPEMERPRAEPRVMSPSAIASRAAARLDLPRVDTPRVAPEPEAEPAPRAERPSRNLFDTVWPTDQKRPDPAPTPPSRERAMFAPPEEAEPSRDPFDLAHAAVQEALVQEDRPPARVEPKLNMRPAPNVEPRPEPRLEARPEPKSNAAILKSGVIDGMAYTLYTDGSIEAQLPGGVMRFGSIDDLRSYLERGA